MVLPPVLDTIGGADKMDVNVRMTPDQVDSDLELDSGCTRVSPTPMDAAGPGFCPAWDPHPEMTALFSAQAECGSWDWDDVATLTPRALQVQPEQWTEDAKRMVATRAVVSMVLRSRSKWCEDSWEAWTGPVNRAIDWVNANLVYPAGCVMRHMDHV